MEVCIDPLKGFSEKGDKAIYFMGTRELRSENEENRGTKAILGNRKYKKLIFCFLGNRETERFISGEHGNR